MGETVAAHWPWTRLEVHVGFGSAVRGQPVSGMNFVLVRWAGPTFGPLAGAETQGTTAIHLSTGQWCRSIASDGFAVGAKGLEIVHQETTNHPVRPQQRGDNFSSWAKRRCFFRRL